MVYSMLSNGGRWSKFMKYFNIDTGEITAVDDIFRGYNPDYILSCNPDDLANNIMGFTLGNKSVGIIGNPHRLDNAIPIQIRI